MTVREFLASLTPEQLKGLENLLKCVDPKEIYRILMRKDQPK